MPNRFSSLIQEALRFGDLAQLMDAVYVFGETGVGKSALIAYLQGCQLRFEKDLLVVDSCPEGVIPAKIGIDVESETLFPTAYRHFNQSLMHVDFPGFYGNRDKDVTLLEFLATQVSIKTTQSVKAVLFLLSFNKMQDPKAAHILSNFEILASLFKASETDSVPPIHLVITHLPQTHRPSKTDVVQLLHRAYGFINRTRPMEKRMAQLFSHFTGEGAEQRIILFNPLRNHTREIILNRLAHLPSFAPNAFDLVGSSKTKQDFLAQLQTVYRDASPIFSVLLNAEEKTQRVQTQLDQLTHSLKDTLAW